MRSIILPGVLVLCLCAGGSDAVRGTSCSSVVGVWPEGPSRAMALDGSIAFWGRGRELVLVDASAPAAHPLPVLARLTLAGLPLAIAISPAVPGLAAVAMGPSGVALVDASNPSQPALLATVDPGGPALGVAFGPAPLDHDLFVALDTVGLRILDIADPSAPLLLGLVDTPGNARDVAVGRFAVFAGDPWSYVAFVADGYSGVTRVDVTNPLAPQVVGSSPLDPIPPSTTSPPARAVLLRQDVGDDRLAVGAGPGGVRFFQIASGIGNPGLLWNQVAIDPPSFGDTLGLAREGNLLYVADLYGGLEVIDISTHLSPSLLVAAATVGRAWGVAVSGGYAFVAADEFGLLVHHLQTGPTPSLWAVNSLPGAASAAGVAAAGRYAYVADSRFGLQVIDLLAPGGPARVSPPDAFFVTSSAIALAGGSLPRVVLGDSFGVLHVFDVASPTAPSELGSVALAAAPVLSLAVAGVHAFAAMGSGDQLVAVDLSNPSAPQVLDSVPVAGFPIDVALVGNLAYVSSTNGNTLAVVDVTNPAAMQVLGTPGFSSPAAFVAQSGIGYLAGGAGLTTLSLADPTAPSSLGGLGLPTTVPRDLALSGGFAHVGGGLAGAGRLFAVDVLDPTTPSLAGTLALPSFVNAVAAHDNRLLLADGDAGLAVVTDCQTLLRDGFEDGAALPGHWSTATSQ